jgi:rRNA-processing protein FCF1
MSEESSNKKDKDADILIANTIYPEAEPIFGVRLKPLEEIKSDCFIVLDTNALLVPYTTSKDSLEQIRRTCKALAGEKRLIIPGQVAREFAKNRAKKIGELYQQLSAKRDSAPTIKKEEYPLLESVKEYQESLRLEDELNKQLGEYRKAINKVLDHVKAWAWDDPVSLLYGELFTGGVVMDVSFDEGDVRKEFARRKLHNIPPGYKDAAAGDLLIWLTILEIGKAHKKSLIFVSGDEKADWYHISNKQPLYPRFELVDEYRRASGGQSFHIVHFSKFLGLYGASERVVEEVRKEEVQISVEPTRRSEGQVKLEHYAAEAAVFRWLESRYTGTVAIAARGSYVDFVVHNPDGTLLGAEVQYFPEIRSVSQRRITDAVNRLFVGINKGLYVKALLVLVATNSEALARLNHYIDSFDLQTVSFTIGLINDAGEFEALRSTA